MLNGKIHREILEADERRYQALYEADTLALRALLHDDYLHTHANGKTEDKAGFLSSIRVARYHFVHAERSAQTVRIAMNVAVLNGITKTIIKVGEEQRAMNNAFVSVWVKDGNAWSLLHWQATKAGVP
jgi:hypothetical protein